MTLHDPARRPCANPAQPCDNPAATLTGILPESPAGGLACPNPGNRGLDPVLTLSTLRVTR